MGIGILKRLLDEAKSSSNIITLEATVITGFEFQAMDECKHVCQPVNVARAKGRIFFNIKKESYPNVLKMRSIDNVFLVSAAFEELKLKKVKDEDLAIIKQLAEEVNWGKSVPEWAEIVGFKGIQFPKCANKDQRDPLNNEEPVCQICQNAKGGGESKAENVVEHGELQDVAKECESPKINVISDEKVFQTPPDNCAEQEFKTPELCPKEHCEPEDGSSNGAIQSVEDKEGRALKSSPEEKWLTKQTEDTDDEAFHSAEEDVGFEGPTSMSLPKPGEKLPVGDGSNVESAEHPAPDLVTAIAPQVPAVDVKSHDGPAIEPLSTSQVVKGADSKQAKCGKNKSKWQRRKEEKRNRKLLETDTERASQGSVEKEFSCGVQIRPQLAHEAVDGSNLSNENIDLANEAPQLNDSEEANLKGQSKAPEEKKKNYWQKRKEAKAKKAAEAKAKKPPRKAFVDDGIMKFRVTCYRNGPKHSFESNDAAGHFGGLINDKFHWNVDLTRHDLNVVLVIEDDSAYVSMALTSQSLHRRNIKNFGPTTLRATLCYGLLRLAEPQLGDIVMDPMCGGGSISIEGALSFPGTYQICGDVNEKCTQRVADNIAYNSAAKPLIVDGFQWSVRRLPLRDESIDVLVTDLPFGLRVGKQKDNTGLYTAALMETGRVVRSCGRASLLTYDRTAMIRALQRTKHIWREIECKMVNQGGLRCFAYLLLRKSTSAPEPHPNSTAPASLGQPTNETSGDRQTGEPALSPEHGLRSASRDAPCERAQPLQEDLNTSLQDDTADEMSQLLDELDLQNPAVPVPNELPAGSANSMPCSEIIPEGTNNVPI